MSRALHLTVGAALAAPLLWAAAWAAEEAPPPAAPVPTLAAAEVVSRFKAPEANQGVGADATALYVIDNSLIAKYDKASGKRLAEWRPDRRQVPHLNACKVLERRLVCSNSNYPHVPQSSSVEILDPATMKPVASVALGPGNGSLTWIDRHDGFWWAGFANYDGRGGEPGRGSAYTTLVKYDDQWRRLEAWLFPDELVDRFKPYSSSGGGWGEDGLLYVSGHDRPELYAMRLPKAGSVLEHVATIPIPVGGQAIAWDPSRPRVLYGISREGKEVVAMRIPPVTVGR